MSILVFSHKNALAASGTITLVPSNLIALNGVKFVNGNFAF
jgi:hypothetical protein